MESTQNVAPQTPTTSEPPPLVRLSDKAAAMVKETIERENLQGSGLRVAVVGGGCSGFQYSLDIEKEQRAGDMIFEVKGVRSCARSSHHRGLAHCLPAESSSP